MIPPKLTMALLPFTAALVVNEVVYKLGIPYNLML
jgi:hypothetical protein